MGAVRPVSPVGSVPEGSVTVLPESMRDGQGAVSGRDPEKTRQTRLGARTAAGAGTDEDANDMSPTDTAKFSGRGPIRRPEGIL